MSEDREVSMEVSEPLLNSQKGLLGNTVLLNGILSFLA